ncbi:synaptotagmin [Anabaena cylindrica FACHB-243]|uniref:Synaptotagmin-like protein 3 (Exophilin-6) n=2 Tax=Nostocaceae TaxID=1162 RepID=K9ZQG4_ANACC|nr:Synaptotagmin-like protein 3 (Exophilin-6) [Anabaena cylindrica PCC 7122]MBD2418269.1 synaptotagmin [Anabaena cylindrica FACHB-243]MBY5280769.1 synaptotagmin [Anabaena sp. CCAP 1446/1C]MBY5311462.1 synaptotagmin [Anabaena sp. CCAP 1446/1C]
MIILSAFISSLITWLVENSADAASQWLHDKWKKHKCEDCNPPKLKQYK